MGYEMVGVAALLAHSCFLAYLVLGGFLAWRWPRTFWLHAAVVLWGAGSVAVGYGCPLTGLESWARERAGAEGLPAGGFIEHYLTGVVYPERYLVLVQTLAGLAVLVSWVGLWRYRADATASGAAGQETPREPSRRAETVSSIVRWPSCNRRSAATTKSGRRSQDRLVCSPKTCSTHPAEEHIQ